MDPLSVIFVSWFEGMLLAAAVVLVFGVPLYLVRVVRDARVNDVLKVRQNKGA